MVALSVREALEAASTSITPEKALLDSLREINSRFLLALMNAVSTCDYENRAELGAAGVAFQALNPDSAARASQFPFLLMDLRLSEAAAVGGVHALLRQQTKVRERGLPSKPAQQYQLAIARAALMLAWHSARTDAGAALILFGLSPGNATDLSSLALHEIETLAPYCTTPLRPRWTQSPQLWQRLLTPASCESLSTVRGFVLHAFQMSARSHLR